MVTGAIWEKVVFGRYLFAPAFFWEDVVSMGVIASTRSIWSCFWWLGYTSGANVDRACSLCSLCRQRRAVSQEIPAQRNFGRDGNVIHDR